jgi:hypothetical protein
MTMPSVDTVMASLPVLDCSHARSYTGSLWQGVQGDKPGQVVQVQQEAVESGTSEHEHTCRLQLKDAHN